MKKLRKRALVKWDYDSFPEEWKVNNENTIKNTLCYIGEIPNMRGHGLCIDIIDKKTYILHIDELKELSKEEV